MSPRIDGRLLVPAAGAWAGAALVRAFLLGSTTVVARHERAMPLVVLLVGALVAAVAGGLLVVAAVAHRRSASSRVLARGPGWPIPVLLAAVFGLLGGLSAAANLAAMTAPPVGAWVDARATAVVEGVVTTEPRTRHVAGAAAWQDETAVEIRLATSRIGARGSIADVDLPLVVRLPVGAVPPPPGTAVEVIGRLAPVGGPSDAAGTLLARALTETARAGVVDRAAHAMRAGLAKALEGVPADAGSLVAGLAVGDESRQPDALAADMRASGLSHLTAVSGGNVAILLTVVIATVVLLRMPLVARIVAAMAALAYFLVLVGPQPSVLRACAMGAIATVGLLVGGRRAGPSVLGAGVLLLVLLAPWLATSWGFALSVLATAGLILLAPEMADRLDRGRRTRRWPPGLREAVALTTAAQVATLPVLVAMGGSVGWVALPANLVVMPVVPPITVLGLAAAGLAPLAPGPAGLAAHVASWPASWIALVAHTAAGLPLVAPTVPDGWTGLGLLAALAVLGVVAIRLRRRLVPHGLSRPVRIAAGVAVAATLVAVTVLPPRRWGWPPPGWFLIMCDVGQGDALLLRSGEDTAVVVDAGPDPDAVDRCLDDAGIRTVPAVVLTHFHADHVAGLSGVLRDRSVARVLLNPIRDPVDQAEAVDAVLAGAGVASEEFAAGDARTTGQVSWRAIWPRRRIDAGSVPNNASIVLVATVAGHRVLLTGDVEPEAQAAIGSDLRGLVFDVVKVPHHGSRYQSPQLTSWAPAPVALISVGAGNDYGHPAAETISAWEGIGALVARTDLDGDVAVVTTGMGVGVVDRHGMLPSS